MFSLDDYGKSQNPVFTLMWQSIRFLEEFPHVLYVYFKYIELLFVCSLLKKTSFAEDLKSGILRAVA